MNTRILQPAQQTTTNNIYLATNTLTYYSNTLELPLENKLLVPEKLQTDKPPSVESKI